MDHPDWPAFVSAVLAHPDDDTVRLVAADFLEENGDADRAAFIRVQCALAQLEDGGQGKSSGAEELRQKVRAFLRPLSTFRLLRAVEACPELVRMTPPARGAPPLAIPQVQGAERLVWRRGFVEAVVCPAAEWLRHGAAVRARQPVRDVTLTRCDALPRDEWYRRLDAVRGLRKVALDDWDETGALAGWLRGWLPGVEVSVLPL
jgi:uncharacterized protein (TIGR02996 family)